MAHRASCLCFTIIFNRVIHKISKYQDTNEARSNSHWKIHVYGQISHTNLDSCVALKWHKANVKELLARWKLSPPGVTQLVMGFFSPFLRLPSSHVAVRSAIPLCPVISCCSSFLGKGQGRNEIPPKLPKGAASPLVTQPQKQPQGGSRCVPHGRASTTAQPQTFHKPLGRLPAPWESQISPVLPGRAALSGIRSLSPLEKCN